MQGRKVFAGAKVRNLRQSHALTQRVFAGQLGISTSYLNQIENNQRPLSVSVILALADRFSIDIAEFASDSSDRLATDLRETLTDPLFEPNRPSGQELKIATSNTPDFARSFLTLAHAYKTALERLESMDDVLQSRAASLEPQPYEEVRDFFHYNDNYINLLDRGAETLAEELEVPNGSLTEACISRLRKKHGVQVVEVPSRETNVTLREYVPQERTLHLNSTIPEPSRTFQLLQQIADFEEADTIEQLLDDGSFRSNESRSIARLALINYFAGAAFLPYGLFTRSAKECRHDLGLLAHKFGASLEQVAHRLSTLQRPGAKGIPIFFLRVDRAGTITKRHSATRLQFARYGGACPIWAVHRAFESPGEFVRQRAITPDGEKYFCVATTISKQAPGYGQPLRRYAISIGCQIEHANDIVYADGLTRDDERAYDEIGISCRICERSSCPQRAVPPVGQPIFVNPRKRGIVPFRLTSD